jgi:hypothetical protein
MIHRGPDFLAEARFGSPPAPSSPPVSKLSLFLGIPVCRWSILRSGKGEEGGGRGAESYDRKKARTSINSLILFDCLLRFGCTLKPQIYKRNVVTEFSQGMLLNFNIYICYYLYIMRIEQHVNKYDRRELFGLLEELGDQCKSRLVGLLLL